MAEHKTYAHARSAASMEAAQRELAYYLWERDGRPEGRADFYWFRAAEVLDNPPEVAAADDGPARRRASPRSTAAVGASPRRARTRAARPEA